MKKSLDCIVKNNIQVNDDFFILEAGWEGVPPKAGQFFMLKPQRTSVFLPRPVSVFEYDPSGKVIKFLIVKVGTGTREMALLETGEILKLTGPLGNSWASFLPDSKKSRIALVGGSAGIAPLAALIAENQNMDFHFYAGFKNGFTNKENENTVLGSALKAQKLVITAEDGVNAVQGRVIDFIDIKENYDALLACGSREMIKAAVKFCETANIPCYVSIDSRMACGVGACLGCTVKTKNGNRSCCADGPVFPAGDLILDE
ncbi:MAG: dihydroorotate dehydrogenase electron transfer subunit [Treponema sp.]|nr:dihydroorotate dehydrogenase electron transfer subunit [Treponema sp.]MCL2272335.1 dihydroorotate dehydrogenase electron transfer subunit [Treponema sp.]